MKKVLVLGGTGFVGRHVCEKLQRRAETAGRLGELEPLASAHLAPKGDC